MMKQTDKTGWFYGIGAFVIWGFIPMYFKGLNEVPAEEILAHRILWCVPFTLLLMVLLKKRILITSILSNKKLLGGLMLSTSLISVNWFIYTWAVTHDQILATSLGYFINPILSILLGVFFFQERLSKLQWGAVLFVTLGVVNQVISYGEIPWIALSVATSFALYGFTRKKLEVDSLNGLLVETTMALPFAIAYLIWQFNQGETTFLNQSSTSDVLLVLAGLITAVPLIMFASAAKKIPLNSIGFLQFIAPSISFLIATKYYSEPLGTEQLLSFIFIWLGISMYMLKPLKLVLSKSRA